MALRLFPRSGRRPSAVAETQTRTRRPGRILPQRGRSLTSALCLLVVASVAEGSERIHAGKGSFPQWRTLTFPTEAPLAWVVALPPRLAAIDREGTFWVLEVSESGVRVAGRYGEVASPGGPPVAVRLGGGEVGVAFVARDGRLSLWEAGALRSLEVGAPLSPLTAPAPVSLGPDEREGLIAIGGDGGVLLVGGLPAAPRVLAHVAVHALPDARITVGDVDGDGVPEAVVLTDPTRRYPHGILGDRVEAGSLTLIEAQPFGLALKGRFQVTATAVFEELSPVLATLTGDSGRSVLLAKSYQDRGTAVAVLGWNGRSLVPLGEAPAIGYPNRWTHVLGAADLDGDGFPEVLAVQTPHVGGTLIAYHLKAGALEPVAYAPGYSSHVIGSRNQEQAAIADLDGNGLPEAILPRQSRETLVGLELVGPRFVERWSYRLRRPISSNLVIADLDGDGLLDLAVADVHALHVLLSRR